RRCTPPPRSKRASSRPCIPKRSLSKVQESQQAPVVAARRLFVVGEEEATAACAPVAECRARRAAGSHARAEGPGRRFEPLPELRQIERRHQQRIGASQI